MSQIYSVNPVINSWNGINGITGISDITGVSDITITTQTGQSLGVASKLSELETRLESVESLLHIIIRDVKLEQKYPRLAEIANSYNSELERYRTWERLKEE